MHVIYGFQTGSKDGATAWTGRTTGQTADSNAGQRTTSACEGLGEGLCVKNLVTTWTAMADHGWAGWRAWPESIHITLHGGKYTEILI